jgi:hypothetical protein
MSGGLHLPNVLAGISASEEAEIHKRWDTYDQVTKAMEDLGFMPAMEPQYAEPILTIEDLTESQGKDYTEKYLHFIGWFNYANQICASSEAHILQCDNEIKIIEARMRENLRKRSDKKTAKGESKPPPLAEMADTIRLDQRIIELTQVKQWHTQLFERVSAKREMFESGRALLSRQIEIKKLEYTGAGREGNLNIRDQQGGRARPMRTPPT